MADAVAVDALAVDADRLRAVAAPPAPPGIPAPPAPPVALAVAFEAPEVEED